MTRTVWPAKDPAERLVASFDYRDALDAGETIASALVTATLLAGSDADPSALLDGLPTISGGLVLQPFHGGLDSASYTLRCQATLSPSSRVLVLAATLPVRTA
ncbi:MAG TPA: hypothetical protein PLY80_17850 [Pseudomonadota bacterium]|nr:hypothetical protein [Pseudomonadota bacterium]